MNSFHVTLPLSTQTISFEVATSRERPGRSQRLLQLLGENGNVPETASSRTTRPSGACRASTWCGSKASPRHQSTWSATAPARNPHLGPGRLARRGSDEFVENVRGGIGDVDPKLLLSVHSLADTMKPESSSEYGSIAARSGTAKAKPQNFDNNNTHRMFGAFTTLSSDAQAGSLQRDITDEERAREGECRTRPFA
ncbi:unnamed protein product [Symbiodinium sp. CCMP2592]|nr:unnamed protein product [Symbiodinium sp. CCMP2592]